MIIAELITELSKWPSDFEVRILVDEKDFEEGSRTSTFPTQHVVTTDKVEVFFSFFPTSDNEKEYLPFCAVINTKKCNYERYDQMTLEEKLAWKGKLKK